MDSSFTRGGQLLTLRESGSSPLAWLDEYKLTYSPSPPSSFALSLYREKRRRDRNRGLRERRAFAEGGTHIECEAVAKDR